MTEEEQKPFHTFGLPDLDLAENQIRADVAKITTWKDKADFYEKAIGDAMGTLFRPDLVPYEEQQSYRQFIITTAYNFAQGVKPIDPSDHPGIEPVFIPQDPDPRKAGWEASRRERRITDIIVAALDVLDECDPRKMDDLTERQVRLKKAVEDFHFPIEKPAVVKMVEEDISTMTENCSYNVASLKDFQEIEEYVYQIEQSHLGFGYIDYPRNIVYRTGKSIIAVVHY